MSAIWSEPARNAIEREIWIAVMQTQVDNGIDIPEQAISDYIEAAEQIPSFSDIELEEIAKIEAVTKHDLYARMEYFNKCAGHEYIHLGLTSADIVENAQQLQILRSADVLGLHGVQVLHRLTDAARIGAHTPLVGRTHGRPAQLTTVGKRAADWLSDLGLALVSLGTATEEYYLRGIKGAIGTSQDMVDLLVAHRADGDAEGIDEQTFLRIDPTLEGVLPSVGQCYPRGQDLPIAAAALQIAAACNTICTNVRLWAVLGHAAEARTQEQVGSSAMPHKVNPRYAERVHGLTIVARGYFNMLAEASGGQWFEGDVSTSSTRRIALPGLFHTVDAILANTAYVLDRLELDPQELDQDVQRYLPELATGRVMTAAVAAGLPRSEAHRYLRRAFSADWIHKLGTSAEFPLDAEQITKLIDVGAMTTGAASIASQMGGFEMPEDDDELTVRDPNWPGDLL